MELSTATGWWDLLPFPSHRVQIAEDLWTADTGVIAADDLRTKLVLDYYGGNLNEKTVVDLGCCEGGFAAEFALRGAARSIGVEARKTSFDRCEMVRKLLGLKNLEFVLADVKDVLPKWQNQFDVVFLAGLLYHVADPFSILKMCHSSCRDLTLVDTHVANLTNATHGCSELMARAWEGHSYRGRLYPEYSRTISRAELEQIIWAAWSDESAFWLLEPDLVQMAKDVGFKSVEKVDPSRNASPWFVDKEGRVIYILRK